MSSQDLCCTNKVLWRASNLTSFSPCITETGILLLALSLQSWPRRDWSSWPRLRRASSQTITRPSWQQCDNPTWSHTAFLSRFHARCRSPFRLHNHRSRLLGGSPVESLQSHFILTMSHWSSWLLFASRHKGPRFKSPGGYLCETGILLLALSRFSTHYYPYSQQLHSYII